LQFQCHFRVLQKRQVYFEGNLLRKTQKTIKKRVFILIHSFSPLKLNLTDLDALTNFNGQWTTIGPLPIRVMARLRNWATVRFGKPN
jgi:hypothetical protein